MKTVALGVDGMEPSLCKEWVKTGELPNIAALRREGSYGTSQCTTLISARQWTTHFTGVHADQHGIQGFLKQDNKPAYDTNPGTRTSPDTKKLISTTDIEVKTYPELLAENGNSVGLVNPLPLWPPLELDDGFCVSGMVTPPNADQYTYPELLVDELKKFNYRIDVRYGDRPYGFIDDPLFTENTIGMDELRTDMFDVLDSRIEYIKYCLDQKHPDFLYGLLKTIDIIQHAFWAHMERDDPAHGEAILDSYRRVDSLVGWIRENHSDTNLLIFSDHGFGPRHNPRSDLLQSIAYGIDNKLSVPYRFKEVYRSVFKRESEADLENTNQITGDHDNPAIWMLGGPNTKSIDDLSIYFDDLTPTLLALHDEPVPRSYSGTVLEDVISLNPTYQDVDLDINRKHRADVDTAVSERLYNLGYAEMVEKSHGEE